MSFLRWPTEDARTTPDGHAVGVSEPGHYVWVDGSDGFSYTSWTTRERISNGQHVILRGHFWEPVERKES